MYSKFCSLTQLEDILKSTNYIKGYTIKITQRATFQLLLWMDNECLTEEEKYEENDFKNKYMDNNNSRDSLKYNIIVGKKGMGKTMLSKYYQYEYKNKCIKGFKKDTMELNNKDKNYWFNFWSKQLQENQKSKKQNTIYVIYDGLDELVKENNDITCIEELLKFWNENEQTNKKFIPKIFFNEYLYEELKYSFQDILSVYKMKWNPKEIIDIIIKRILTSSKIIKEFLDTQEVNFRLKQEIKNINKVTQGTNITGSFDMLRRVLLGENINENFVTSSSTLEWFEDYFTDSLGDISPVDVISFFKYINKIYIDEYNKYLKETSNLIYPIHLFVTKENYNVIAKDKLNRLMEEYKKDKLLCDFLNVLKEINDMLFPINLYELMIKVSKLMKVENDDDIKNTIYKLERIGVLENKEDVVYIKSIYLQALDKNFYGYIFRLGNS